MALGLKRTDLQAMAQKKLFDAQVLLVNSCFSSAYYLAGYAIEIGLKACVAKQFAKETIPDKSFVNAVFTHNLKALIGLAGLSKELKDKENSNPNFGANWALVTEWTPEVRYDIIDPGLAQLQMVAITHSSDGVFPWIAIYW